MTNKSDESSRWTWFSGWITLELSQDMLIWLLEKVYILHFMYQDYSAKQRKAEEKKAQKALKKTSAKEHDESAIESSIE